MKSFITTVSLHDEGYSLLPEIRGWLNGLTEAQRQELGSLERTYSLETRLAESVVIREVVKDWIEEHGGRRGWWGYLQTNVCEE